MLLAILITQHNPERVLHIEF